MFVSSNELKAILPYFKRKLASVYDEREIESLFYFVCYHQFGFSRSEALGGDKRLTESELLFFRDVVLRLMEQEPVQYILGKADFYGLVFEVSPAVLIPRPETEELVDLVIKENRNGVDFAILDIGTGSGCIPIAIKKNLSSAAVYGLDVSPDALAIAGRNAVTHDASVTFIALDILKEDSGQLPPLDVVISNPPYIPASEKQAMSENVSRYEPEIALFVPDSDPLLFYRRIAQFALAGLKPGGRIYFEIHYRHGQHVSDLLTGAGFKDVTLLKDTSGADRFVAAVKQ